jgi:hypothetical protein
MRWRTPGRPRELIAAFLILVLVAAVTVYAWPSVLRHLLVTQIQSITQRAVNIDAAAFNPFTGRLVVRGFRSWERDGQTPFTDFDSLDVRFRPFSLWLGHLSIREARLDGSTVRIVRLADAFNISDLIDRPRAPRRALEVTVDRLVVTRGTVTLEDRALAEPRTWRSEHIEIDAHNLSTRRDDGRAVARSVTVGAPVTLEMRQVRLHPIHLEAVVTTSGLDLSLARLYLPRDAAIALERGRASSTVAVTLDARTGLQASVTGTLEDVALVKRGERDPAVLVPRLGIELADFRYQDDQVEVGRFELEGTVHVKDPAARSGGRVQISTLRASIADATWPVIRPGLLEARSSVPGGGTLDLTGRLSPPPAASQLRLRLARVDLGKWASLVPGALRIDGFAEADLRVDEPLAPAVPARVRGSVTVNQLGVKDADTELVRARRVEATGLEVHWPSRLSARRIVVSGPRGTIERDRDGNLVGPPGIPGAAAVGSAAPSTALTPPLALAVGEIVVRDGALVWRDRAVRPPVALEFADLQASVTGAAWPLEGPLGVRAGLRPPGGGRIEFSGRVGVDPIAAEGQIAGHDAELMPYQPYVPLPAKIGGRIDFDLAVVLPPATEGRVTVRGRAGASSIDVRDGARTVMRVERAQATGLDVDWPRRVAIRDLTLRRPWILLERDERGALVLRELLAPQSAGASASSGRVDVPVAIEHLVVEEGAARAADQRVTPPLALDVQRLSGRVDGLSTGRGTRPARVEMAGRVGGDSTLSVRGTMGPLGGPLRLDMNAELHGFAVPRTNPYLVQQVAWEARSGWLTTNVHCRIDGDALDARTDILLRRLEVARAAGHDGAQARVGLPIGMIVALMKDRRGDIRLSLPVGGRLSDPRFDMSEALWSTVRNVAVKAITAPVSWIGRVQVDSDSRIQRVDVDPIAFAPGAAALAPEAREQVARLAAFLEQVPGLRLALTPVVSSQDRAALEEKGLPVADLAARRLEAVREGIKKAGADGERLIAAAPASTDSAEGQVKVDLVEPADSGPPGRPGFLKRLLGETGSGSRATAN